MVTVCGCRLTETPPRDEEDLVRRYLALVGYAVNDFVRRLPRHVCRADLESAGMEGLAQAARSYDPARGVPFDRYAAYRIRGALLDELRHLDWLGRTARGTARTVEAAHDELTSRLGRTPTAAEVAEQAGVDLGVVQSVGAGAHHANILHGDSIVAAVERARGGSEGPTPEAELLDRERHAYVLDAVAALPERLRRVVVAYFFEDRQMKELAVELGISEGRVSQMRAEALVLLRDGINKHLDPDLVPAPRTNRSTRSADRRAAFFAAVAAGSDYRARLTAREMAVQ